MSGRCRDNPCSPGSGCPECDPDGHARIVAERQDRITNPRCPNCDGWLAKGGDLQTIDPGGTTLHTACVDQYSSTLYPYPCPKCNETGYGANWVLGSLGSVGSPCDLCEGLGRLKDEPIPITETKIVGWKRGE